MKSKFYLLYTVFICCCFHISTARGQENSYRSVKDATRYLVNTISKKGAVEFSIPQPASVLSEGETANFKDQITKWLGIYGEGLYNAKPWRITREGPSADTISNYTGSDFRFTAKDNAVYVFVIGAPGRDMRIKSLACTSDNKPIDAVTLLGSAERVSWEQREAELLIDKPLTIPAETIIAFKITFQEYYKPSDKKP